MRYFTCGVVFAMLYCYAGASGAADENGYNALYECRPGGTYCNIDIPALASTDCQVTVTTADSDWSKIINSSARFFCIAAGDHSGKGTLTLRSAGSASARKVLRYTSADDDGRDPWKQSEGQRARIRKLDLDGADYWLIHRLSIDGGGWSQNGIFIGRGSNNNIIDRVLVQNHHGYQLIGDWNGENDRNVIQNSVLRKAYLDRVFEAECIDTQKSTNMRVVNNEVYDCHKAFSVGSGVVDTRGLVVENNDFYVSTQWYTDCNGNFNGAGPCSGSEAVMSIKAGGIAGNPALYIHNRIWGGRPGDGNLIGFDSSGNGTGISISASGADNPGLKTDYLLFANNVVMDSQKGITGWWGPDDNLSIIGNILYNIRAFNGSAVSVGMELNAKRYSEIYLNTIINTDQWIYLGGSAASGGSADYNDIRCNVVINGGGNSISPGYGTVIDNNAFYNTTPYTTASGSVKNLVRASAVDAQAGDYCFYRKLKTGAERVCIPNAKPQSSSPHTRACDGNLGTQPGIGISDAPVL
jgi:hypothetical protein